MIDKIKNDIKLKEQEIIDFRKNKKIIESLI